MHKNVIAQGYLALSLLLVSGVTLVVPSGYSVGFWCLSFVGCVGWFFVRDGLKEIGRYALVWPVLVYAMGSMLLGLHEQFAWRSLDVVLPFVFMIFGVWLLRRYKPCDVWLWCGIAIGAVGAACFAAYQVLTVGGRAGGYLHPIQFGNIALLLGVLCMVRALVHTRLVWLNVLMWVGFFAGVLASTWSQTRGGWVAIVLVFLWVFLHATQSWTWVKKLTAMAVMVGCLAVLGSLLGLHKVIEIRVLQAATETQAFLNDNNQDSPVGSRLAMWRFALEQVGHSPIWGVGKQGWVALRDQGIADGKMSAPYIANLTHLHNEYLDAVVKRGVVGLFLLLMLYLGPMLLFFRHYLSNANTEVKSLAMGGMVLIMMYMDFGLTQTFLSHNSGRMVFVSLLMCFGALLLNAVEVE